MRRSIIIKIIMIILIKIIRIILTIEKMIKKNNYIIAHVQ